MAFLPSLSPTDLRHYHRVVTYSMQVRSHFDVLVWLQGDMQHYLPHDIMIAAWGNFCDGAIQHDIISTMAGVRSKNSNPETLTPLLVHLFERWTELGNRPLSLNSGESGFLLSNTGLNCALGHALQTMRTAMAHGIRDERGSHDCLYVTFSTKESSSDAELAAMATALPYIDTALRQVEHLPHQTQDTPAPETMPVVHQVLVDGLSVREDEVMQWVALGKTNPEIGKIMEISEFTVKNHLQRVFKKLDVTNRAQAVGKYKALTNHV